MARVWPIHGPGNPRRAVRRDDRRRDTVVGGVVRPRISRRSPRGRASRDARLPRSRALAWITDGAAIRSVSSWSMDEPKLRCRGTLRDRRSLPGEPLEGQALACPAPQLSEAGVLSRWPSGLAVVNRARVDGIKSANIASDSRGCPPEPKGGVPIPDPPSDRSQTRRQVTGTASSGYGRVIPRAITPARTTRR